jgi:PGM1 C-terminal domain
LFRTPAGDVKHLVATDHLELSELRALTLDDLFDIVARHRLHYDRSRQEGVVFHMLSSLTELGRIGMTSVGDTPERAGELYRRAEDVLLAEARAALRDIEVDI